MESLKEWNATVGRECTRGLKILEELMLRSLT